MSGYPEGVKPDTKVQVLGFPQDLVRHDVKEARRRAEPNEIVLAKDISNLEQCLKFGLVEVVEEEDDKKSTGSKSASSKSDSKST